ARRRPRPAARSSAVGPPPAPVPAAGRHAGARGARPAAPPARALADRRCRAALDVIAFSEEEGVRFGTPYLGSLAVCGRFDPALFDRTDAAGVTLAQALRDYGLDPAAVPAAAYPPGQVVGYLEAHIEQGPVLEALDLS